MSNMNIRLTGIKGALVGAAVVALGEFFRLRAARPAATPRPAPVACVPVACAAQPAAEDALKESCAKFMPEPCPSQEFVITAPPHRTHRRHVRHHGK